MSVPQARDVRCVLLDLGNVVLRFSHERMYRQLADCCGADLAHLTGIFHRHDLLRELETGRLTAAQVRDRVQAHVAKELRTEELMHAGSDIFEAMPEMDRIVADLADRFRLVLLSNTSAPHMEFIRRRFPVVGHFDAAVLSYEVGVAKPDPAIYRAALRTAGCPPERCVYFDDLEANVAGAHASGLPAFVFADAAGLRRDLAGLGVELTAP